MKKKNRSRQGVFARIKKNVTMNDKKYQKHPDWQRRLWCDCMMRKKTEKRWKGGSEDWGEEGDGNGEEIRSIKKEAGKFVIAEGELGWNLKEMMCLSIWIFVRQQGPVPVPVQAQ